MDEIKLGIAKRNIVDGETLAIIGPGHAVFFSDALDWSETGLVFIKSLTVSAKVEIKTTCDGIQGQYIEMPSQKSGTGKSG